MLGLVLVLGLALPAGAQQKPGDPWRKARERLVTQIAGAGIEDSATLAAMRTVPRHEFVPPEQRPLAYEDIPLPIGHGQTISQPAVVAMMTQLIAPRAGMRVLEVGTGSGYQAAVLAETGCRVWTIEIFRAPFDAILVTAAADSIPPALLEQLATGGRLVMPVGDQFTYQELVLVEKDAAGRLTSRQLFPVRFVPLLREVR